MKKICRFLFAGFYLIPLLLTAQVDSPSKLKKQAEQYFHNGLYNKADYFYDKYKRLKSPDAETWLKIGISSYHVNDLSTAESVLKKQELSAKNVDPKIYLFLGKIEHANNKFSAAAQYYKSYLASTKDDAKKKRLIRDKIRRCAVGEKLTFKTDLALVENLGKNINSEYDDFAPIQSRNYSQKIYFSSERVGSKGGLRNSKGERDNEYGSYSSDIYFSHQDQGAWVLSEPLEGLINSPRREVLIDFNADGSALYFFKGMKTDNGEIYINNFSSEDDEVVIPEVLESPMKSIKGDGAPFFYNDSLVIFSSRRNGGFGGYDLYGMIMKEEEWQRPFNLGPVINSAYDETSPYMALDGRTLYFSSNNSRKSLGGLDVFTCSYDDLLKEWSEPMNMGLSINSSEDDSHFRLTRDGMRAYFSSTRKEGLGNSDIYVAYFKDKRQEQLATLFPITFMQLEDIENRIAMAGVTEDMLKNSDENSDGLEDYTDRLDKKMITIKNLYFDEDRDLLGSENKKKIVLAVELLKRYPSLKVILNSHSNKEGTLPFNMYFSIKRAEKVAQDMISEGIDSDRIVVAGFGPLYPTALDEINGSPNLMGQKLNRRIEFLFNGAEDELSLDYERPNVSKFQEDKKADFHKEATKGLYYKIQIASTSQMLDDKILDTQPDPMIEKRMDKDRYLYTVGLYRSFSSAVQFQNELRKIGAGEGKIVPYLNGYRIARYKVEGMIESYPDLQRYLDYISEY